jgi:hypothetical protein
LGWVVVVVGLAVRPGWQDDDHSRVQTTSSFVLDGMPVERVYLDWVVHVGDPSVGRDSTKYILYMLIRGPFFTDEV